MLDQVITQAAKQAAIAAMRGYHVQFNAMNESKLMGTHVFKDVVFDDKTGETIRKARQTPLAEKTWREYKGHVPVVKSAASRPLTVSEADRLYRQEQRLSKAAAVEALLKQSADWERKAADGRVAGLDSEVVSLYRRKSQAAKEQAEALKAGRVSEADRSRATALELEAERHERQAAAMPAVNETARRHRERAGELRDRAANIRAGRPEEYRAPGDREIAFRA